MKRLVARPITDIDVEAAYVDLAGRRADGRPYVVLNMVASTDGAIAVEGRTKALSSEADRFVFHHLRSLADVILVGAQTVRAEGYGPPKVSDERQAERVARGQEPVPRIAIVSGSLDLDWSSRLFRESPTRPFVLTGAGVDATEASAVAEVVAVGDGTRADLPAALAELRRRGVGVVLCEGGPTLNGLLAADDLIDELCLTVAPALVGGEAGAGILGHQAVPELLPVHLVHALEAESGDLFLRYRRSTATQTIEPNRRSGAEPAEPPEDPLVDAFNETMNGLDFPMVVVTAADGDERSGCLVGFHVQCSIEPPRYMVWISKKNHTYLVARGADVLAVHFPGAGQRDLAERFGTTTGDEVDKFASVAWHAGPEGVPILDDVQRWFAGRVVETLDAGDHVGFTLQPLEGEANPWEGQLGFQSVKDLDAGKEP